MTRSTLAALVFSVAALSACSDNPVAGPDAPPLSNAAPLDSVFARAGAEFDVPAELLGSIAYVETQWEMVEGAEEFEGVPAAFGVMALRGENLERGAALAGVSVEAARTDAAANVRSAAALLSRWASEAGTDRGSLAAWEPLVVRYSGIEVPEAQQAYARAGVLATLQQGTVVRAPDGRVRGAIRAVEVGLPLGADGARLGVGAASADYGPAIWRPSPNFNARPSGTKPSMVIVHTCEGSYAGCWGWLTNSQAGASAHYVVNATGSEVSQLVRESNRAWHIAASYDCSRNGNVDCAKNGASSNHFTLGIEHAGYASQSSFNAGMVQASANLSCSMSQKYGIARDRYHFVGHGQLQPWNRTDPGPNWPWTDYLNRINVACGGTTPPPSSTIVVDSNNGSNDTSVGYVETSANWTASSHPTDYGTGYWWAGTAAVSDGATFWFYLPQGGRRTVDAWWVAGTNRASAAPFLVYDAQGRQLGSVAKDQRSGGGTWNALGTWTFTAGWNRVVLSRWTTPGSVVVADAVRMR